MKFWLFYAFLISVSKILITSAHGSFKTTSEVLDLKGGNTMCPTVLRHFRAYSFEIGNFCKVEEM